VLVGREAHRARIDALVEAACAGRSGVLLLRGEAGLGKTALCDYAAERAAGMTVLRARCAAAETELAFSALADLLRPVLAHLEALPRPQADALAAALALGPPTGGDRFTVCAATLSLLGVLAEDGPVLVLVDDAQWLDPSSTDALVFAARRLEAEGIALVVTLRPGGTSELERGEFDRVELAGLERAAARQLLAELAGGEVADPVAERLWAATAGNPLALVEFASLLGPDELAGRRPLPEPLPLGPNLERAFRRRIDDLPEAVRRALVVAAAGESERVEDVVAALALLGVDESALARAETRELVSVEGDRLAFRHPLLRAAAYESAPVLERRAAHRALATAASGRGMPERRALHLAAGAPAPDEDTAATLEEAARRARGRGGTLEAASVFEQAARLSRDPEQRARRLHEAANQFRLGGEVERALEMVEEALGWTRDEALRAELQHLRGRAEMWRGEVGAGHVLLVDEASRIAARDPSKAATMLIDAAMLALEGGRLATAAEAARQACSLAPEPESALALLCRAALGTVNVLRGDARGQDELGRLVEALAGGAGGALPAHQLVPFAAWSLVWSERYDEAGRLLGAMADRARAASAPGELPLVLACLSDLDFRLGRWSSAYAEAAEAVRLATETRQTGALPYGLTSLARVAAAQGREDECRRHAASALAIGARVGADSVVLLARAALGLLELGLGRTAAAIDELEQVERASARAAVVEPLAVQWSPDLVEAYARAGRRHEAEEALARLEEQAQATGRSWAHAVVGRCRGLLGADDDIDAAFESALRRHADTPTPFERARTELVRGERLRRARRRTDAREALRSALSTFERLGAVPWMERARTELHASGETLRRPADRPLHELTPQELQVALVVARGATNREAGAALFLSPKTVEAHLGRVYRKLSLRSRTELAHALAGEHLAAA
jgi:DNA-binding CsgD family transcriptional regulator